MAETMRAMVTMGHGGFEVLKWHEDWPKPNVGKHEVLIRVKACGLNNTDVNTRSGWYSKQVTEATTGGAYASVDDQSVGGWGSSTIQFPRIQGADLCGVIEAVGEGVNPSRIGERVISNNWLRDPNDPHNLNKTGYLGSERDGGFAEYVTLPTENALTIVSPLSDAELATFSCSYATAEGMLTRAKVTDKDTVLVTGASGGVGSALIQLAKLRGARVIAMASLAKHATLQGLGADRLIDRAPDNLQALLADETITVIADIVGGDYWPNLIDILERGGRYTCSGAIAGPMVELDLRTLYLNDLTFTGSTITAPEIIQSVVTYIEQGKLKPMLAATYPLNELQAAQQAFIDKQHVGNIAVTID